MSRPEKPIDWDYVDQLLIAGCLGTEIAAIYDMHPDTFYNRVKDKYSMGFTEYCYIKRSHGDSLLRKAQFDKAYIDKDNTMLIWLGKHRLNQIERREEDPHAKERADVLAEFKSLAAAMRQACSPCPSADTAHKEDPSS